MAIVIILMIALSNADKIMDMFKGDGDQIGIVTNSEPIYKAIKQQGNVIDEDSSFKKVNKQEAKKQVKMKS